MVRARLSVFPAASAACVMLLAPAVARAQARPDGIYALDRPASAVGFTISASMIFKTKEDGSFNDFTGSLSYDPASPTDTRIDLTVFTASIDTHNAEHNELLKSGDFFDVANYPTMRFVSASTATLPDGTFSMTGDMTIRGVTRRMTIPVRLKHDSAGAHQSSALFESTFQIDRTEFGLNGLPKWHGLKVSIAKKVDVHIAIATTLNTPR